MSTPAPYPVQPPPGEILLVNGRIHTDPGAGVPFSALAIAGSDVRGGGTRAEAEALVSSRARVVDLAGRTVMPAFIESHTHYHRAAVLARCFLDFDTLAPESVEEVLTLVAARAVTLAADGWVQGDSLSAARLAEGRWPDRHELDRAGEGRPVVLRGIGKHVVAASTSALAAAGIDAGTPDPAGGRIEREADGTPSGILHEQAKLRLDQSHPATVVPTPGPAERRAAVLDATRDLHRMGIATLHEMIRLPDEAGDWTALHAAGELGVRVRLFYRVHESSLDLGWLESLGIRRGLGDDWLKVLGVKISVDGFDIFRNAAVYKPYAGTGGTGLMRIEVPRLRDLVARANAQGLQVAVHAVGARAVDVALDALEAAAPATAGPFRVEHAYVDTDETHLRRILDLGAAWSTQPAFRTAYQREWADVFPGPRREALMPLALAEALGIPLLFNSDAPCAPVDPLGAIRAAVDPPGSWGPHARVSRVTAWRACTVNAADAAGEPRLGRLAAGSLADLVVFDDDPLDPGTDLNGLTARGTMVAGRPKHGEAEVFA